MGRRSAVPALAFFAAFLVSFNVFANYRDANLHLPRLNNGGRVDPLTQSTASFVASSSNDHLLDRDQNIGGGGAEASSSSAVAVKGIAISGGGGDIKAVATSSSSFGGGGGRGGDGGGGMGGGVVNNPKPRPTDNPKDPRHVHPFQPKENTEFGGDVVKWGDEHLKPSARACYESCLALVDAKPLNCNIWVYCPDPNGCTGGQKHKACWLKHQPRPAGGFFHHSPTFSSAQLKLSVVTDGRHTTGLMLRADEKVRTWWTGVRVTRTCLA